MLYEKLLKAFNEALKDIHLRISSPLEEANLVIALCTLSLAKFQKAVEKNGFQNIDKEIYFFKSVKVIPMQYLIYYTELRSCELGIPKGGDIFQIQFLEKLQEEVNLFFKKHKEFLSYIELKHTLLDKYYYTRKYIWTYYIRLDIRLRDLALHNLTLNYEKITQKLQFRI